MVMMVMTALMTAVICVISPFSIPIGPVPVSLGTLALFLAVYVLGTGYGTVATVLYLCIGFAGLPVFSAFSGGVGKLLGPTGGYIIGYIPMVVIAGIIIDKTKNRVLQGLGMVLAEVVLYAAGTAWFVISTGTPIAAALSLCVIPFIPGDLVKIVVVLAVAPQVIKLVRRN
ncbi:MAG: biotin transporter BioY [Eubacterium sp.]|nr:biotin transporter BioY [Eubacterium sp.]